MTKASLIPLSIKPQNMVVHKLYLYIPESKMQILKTMYAQDLNIRQPLEMKSHVKNILAMVVKSYHSRDFQTFKQMFGCTRMSLCLSIQGIKSKYISYLPLQMEEAKYNLPFIRMIGLYGFLPISIFLILKQLLFKIKS